MASKKSGYSPKKHSLPTFSRKGTNLGKYVFGDKTVMYCWVIHNAGPDYMKAFADFQSYFIFDFLNLRGRRISVRVAPDTMDEVLTQCDEAVTSSNLEAAEEIVLSSYRDIDKRNYFSTVLGGIGPPSSILPHYDSWNTERPFAFFAEQIVLVCYGPNSEEELQATVRKLEPHLEQVYQSEKDISDGKIPKKSVYIDDDFDTQYDEGNITYWPDNMLRISYRPVQEQGGTNPTPWEFLAQRNILPFTTDEQEVNGMIIDMGGPLETIKGQPIVAALSGSQFRQLADSIRSCIAELE